MKTIIFFLLLMTQIFHIEGEIVEVDSIFSLNDYIDHQSLIIFDIDNTLMETEQTLGSDQWFYFRMNELMILGWPEKEARTQTLREWISIQNISKVKVVEEGTSEFVHSLQAKKYNIIGLTTRGLEMSFTTVIQLQALGIKLDETAPLKEDLFFMNGKRGVYYHKGILFTMATSKGDALYKLLTTMGKFPKKIIFINDKLKHLQDVETMCIDKNIPFLGLRYNFLDEKVENFNKKVAQIQFQNYGKILTDEEATQIMYEN